MVKIQKPTPRTLKKDNIQTKSLGKVQKPKKNSNGKAGEDKLAKVIGEKAKTEKKIVATKEKGKELLTVEKNTKKNTKEANESAKRKNPHQKQKKGAQSAKSKPLVLAPVESPKPTHPIPVASGKNKNVEGGFGTSSAKSKGKKQKQKLKKAKTIEVANKPQEPLTKTQKKKASKKAFKKQQTKKKLIGKQKKPKAQPSETFAPVPYDEEQFNTIVNVANVKEIGKALMKQVEKEVAEKKTSIFSDYRYFLNVASFKIPSCPKRVVKLNLKHSLVDKDDDVVIVVPDLKRGAKVDNEPTIQHYEDLFREAGIEGLKIMPFNQLRTECNTFEAVRKFGNSYEYFLCDGRLVGQIAGFCGKVFQKPRTTFHAVRMENTNNLKNEIEKALRRTAYKQLHKGDLISIPVGNHKYTMQQLAENVEHIVPQLKNIYPGSLGNVRNMYLKIDITGTTALPIYISTAQPPKVTPYVVGPREQRMLKLKKDASNVLSQFSITKDADIRKLTKNEIARKRKFKEVRAALLAEDDSVPKKPKETDDEEKGEDITVPTKKSKKEKHDKVEKVIKKKGKVVQPPSESEEDGDDGDANDSSEGEEESD